MPLNDISTKKILLAWTLEYQPLLSSSASLKELLVDWFHLQKENIKFSANNFHSCHLCQ